jgi:spermidine/putrescine transport system substrate-binding protein
MSNAPRGSYTRRQFLGRSGLAVGGLALGPALLAACGGDDKTSTGGGGGKKELYVANWITYIDSKSVGLFETQTGIKTKYTTEYNDNNEYFAKIQPLLGQGKTIDPDIIVPSSWMASRLIALGWVDKLPLDQVPNAGNVRDDLVKPAWDPAGEYTLPWQTGITGIAYNRKVAGRDLTSVNDLLDPAFKGKIGMLTELRDTIGLLMLATDADPGKPSFDAAGPALEKLEKAVKDGQIRSFTGNDYQDDLVAGDFVACIGWSGDVAQLALDDPNLKFVIPDEGGMSWADTMVMPKGTVNTDSVAKWIDFVYDPVNAARITAEVQYVSPVKGVAGELKKLGGDAAALADNTLIFPDDATLGNLHTFGPLSDEDEQKLDEEFSRITGN